MGVSVESAKYVGVAVRVGLRVVRSSHVCSVPRDSVAGAEMIGPDLGLVFSLVEEVGHRPQLGAVLAVALGPVLASELGGRWADRRETRRRAAWATSIAVDDCGVEDEAPAGTLLGQ